MSTIVGVSREIKIEEYRVLLGGVTGVPPANVVIIGSGTVDTNADRISVGLGAIEEAIVDADLIVGAVLLPGCAQAQRVIGRSMPGKLKPGSVLVDVAVDQGAASRLRSRRPMRIPPIGLTE